MTKLIRNPMYLLLLFTALVGGCRPSVDKVAVFEVVGVYQLIWYSTTALSDDNPGGTVEASEVDGEHINLTVKGQSGKAKISYTYLDVLVTLNDDHSSSQVTYNLTYKKRLIGTARIDGVSRYIVLTPSATLRIEGLEL